jgi:hypothetical protein
LREIENVGRGANAPARRAVAFCLGGETSSAGDANDFAVDGFGIAIIENVAIILRGVLPTRGKTPLSLAF